VQSYYADADSRLAVAEHQHGTRVASAPVSYTLQKSTLPAGLSGTFNPLNVTNSIPCYKNYFSDSIANESVKNYSTFS
jgi:hypothetical protein